ncbi:Arrestin-like protein [Neofusicoccum parvum]|nr:Arrestin-like protein [Neofusicoccum parvum]
MAHRSETAPLYQQFVNFRHRDGKRQIVQGDVVFNTNAPTTIRSVKITLRGIRKVSWITDTLQATAVQQKQTLFLQTQHLHIPSDHTTRKSPPGAHTWPFLFALPPHLPESVDWLPANTFITYGLTATVSTGHFSRPQTATERLRLVKTPSFHVPADDYDVSFAPAERELLWPDALIAQVTLAQPLQPTDGALALDFRLLPLGDLAGAVRLGAVKLELVQTLQLVVSRNGAPFRTTRKTRSVASSAASVDELVAAQRAKGGGDEDDDGGGRVCFSVKLPLPGPPYACVQTVDDEGMKVRYALRVGLEVGGAEGEMCERSVLLHPKLFVPVRSEHAGPGSSSADLDPALFEDCPEVSGLPCYGEHLFDTLYCEERGGRISEDILREIGVM